MKIQKRGVWQRRADRTAGSCTHNSKTPAQAPSTDTHTRPSALHDWYTHTNTCARLPRRGANAGQRVVPHAASLRRRGRRRAVPGSGRSARATSSPASRRRAHQPTTSGDHLLLVVVVLASGVRVRVRFARGHGGRVERQLTLRTHSVDLSGLWSATQTRNSWHVTCGCTGEDVLTRNKRRRACVDAEQRLLCALVNGKQARVRSAMLETRQERDTCLQRRSHLLQLKHVCRGQLGIHVQL